jgi:hypothetical protein
VVVGDAQDPKERESTLQANVEPGFDEVKLKVGVESLVSPAGPPVIVVSGGAAFAVAGGAKTMKSTASAEILLGVIDNPDDESGNCRSVRSERLHYSAKRP